jgi:putative FmdB family regulatory protein
MPHYAYQCDTCLIEETAWRPIELRDLHAPACPKCAKKMTRQFSAVPAHFKGKGFYKNDK